MDLSDPSLFFLSLFHSTLALHFIPNCKEIFGRLVAMMGMIKHDNLRWVFSAGLDRPCLSMLVLFFNDSLPTLFVH